MRIWRWLSGAAAAAMVAGSAMAAAPAAPPTPPPAEARPYLVRNDGPAAVEELRLRLDPDGAWSEDLLDGAPIEAGQDLSLPLTTTSPCVFGLQLKIAGRAELLEREVDACRNPQFRLSWALGLPGPGRAGGPALPPPPSPSPSPSYGVEYYPESEASDPVVGAAPDLDRGVPICPGDARCKKKKP